MYRKFSLISLYHGMIMTPLIVIFSYHFSLGGKIENLVLGIVNNEISGQCSNVSSTVDVKGFTCLPENISCRFIDDIENEMVKMVSSVKAHVLRELKIKSFSTSHLVSTRNL